MNNLLSHCPVIIDIPVAWGDMDAFQHLNNTVYFRYFESVRIAYFERLKFLEYMDSSNVGPIVASTACKFKIPLTYPDTVSVGACISKIEGDRFAMDYLVVSHKHQKVAAEGSAVVVSFNYKENKKTAIPDELKKRIEELETTPPSGHPSLNKEGN